MDDRAFALAAGAADAGHTRYPLASAEDLYQDLVVWMLLNQERVEDWCQDELGLAVLFTCLKTEAFKTARIESKRRRELTRDRET